MKRDLFEYVHEVLRQNELIIVPNFGAFIVQKTTTFLNDGEYISIIFSAQQQNDDGVLCKHIAIKDAISESDAEEFIESSLEEIYNKINETGIYLVAGIGEFRAINERIVFKPFEEQYLLGADTKKIIAEIETPAPTPTPTPVEIPKIENSQEKVDIETIRQTYALRNSTANVEAKPEVEKKQPVVAATLASPAIPTNTAKKDINLNKEKNEFDINKLKTPLIILIIIAVLGIVAYVFRNEIQTLTKPTITNDTSQVLVDKGMDQLADTLHEIQNAETLSTVEEPEQTNKVETAARKAIVNPENGLSKTVYGNNTTTLYYVTRASFSTKQAAIPVKQNLDNTGFVAQIIETEGAKKFHVVVSEFEDLQKAKDELSFAKSIDNRFYLLTVKPKR